MFVCALHYVINLPRINKFKTTFSIQGDFRGWVRQLSLESILEINYFGLNF